MAIGFISDENTKPGICYRPASGLRRVVAPNAGPFTYSGTGTYILGNNQVAIIDPGPNDPAHMQALLDALKGARVSHIFVTHTHRDHSPLATALAEQTGAQICGGPKLSHMASDVTTAEEAFDLTYEPHKIMQDGDIVYGEGWTIRAVATPGHTSNHLCFHWLETNGLFSGDHIMGWSTSVIVPPDGDMRAYMQSLIDIRTTNYDCLWPTHGQPIRETASFLDALIQHRLDREAAILGLIQSGVSSIADLVERLYVDVPRTLHPAAAQSVFAHAVKLEQDGRIKAAPDVALNANFTPVF